MADQKKKIQYVKPECVDVGSVLPIQGGICASGADNVGNCTFGSRATEDCNDGYLAAYKSILPGS